MPIYGMSQVHYYIPHSDRKGYSEVGKGPISRIVGTVAVAPITPVIRRPQKAELPCHNRTEELP
jgi:hypothetical protein